MTRTNHTTRGPLFIASLDRIKSSTNGNPAWSVTFTDGTTARTTADASWSYEANNSEFRGAPLMVTFTRAGRIAYARVMEGGES